MTVSDLQDSEYNLFYRTYINLVPKDVTLVKGFYEGEKKVVNFFNAIPKDLLNYKYDVDKWTVKEVFQHIIDTERVFMHRCFRIARRDLTTLTGFEQNDYIQPSLAKHKTLEALIEEYQATRRSAIVLLKSLSVDDLTFIGNANGSFMSSRSAAFSVLGHEIWHLNIIKTRYFQKK